EINHPRRHHSIMQNNITIDRGENPNNRGISYETAGREVQVTANISAEQTNTVITTQRQVDIAVHRRKIAIDSAGPTPAQVDAVKFCVRKIDAFRDRAAE